MATLDDLRALGYEVGIASGSVETEEAALEDARMLADPDRVESDVQEIADKAALDAAAIAVQRGISSAKIPAAVSQAVANITAAALEAITIARNDTVEFHERALELAKRMPTTYVVSGPGFENVYLDIDDATGEATEDSADVAASLTNPDAHRERTFQHRLRDHPKRDDLFGYVTALRLKGYTVEAEIQEDGTGLQARINADGQTETIATTLPQLRAAARDLADLTA